MHRVLVREGPEGGFQSDQANSAHQVLNVWDHIAIDPSAVADAPSGPVLLVDDEVDSRWTMTVSAYRLRQAGLGPVLPFALRAR